MPLVVCFGIWQINQIMGFRKSSHPKIDESHFSQSTGKFQASEEAKIAKALLLA
jgi:hypothetical protein